MTQERSNLTQIADPFFAACAREELVVPRCSDCERLFFYPTVLCPHCHSFEWEYVKVSGAATVYSFTEVHRPLGSALPAPYVVAVVSLAEDESVRLMTNIVDVQPGDVSLGDPVRVRFGKSWDGRDVPLFELVDGGGEGGA